MDLSTLPPTRWTNRLAFDVALRLEGSGENLDEIITRHGIQAADLLVYNKDPVFLRKVADFRTEIREKGVTFRLKARTQAEELLKTSWLLIHDPGVSPAVKADLIKSTVKWAGLEPRNDVGTEGGSGGVKITINLGGQELGTATVIDATPSQVEHDQDDPDFSDPDADED
jgi:hypothetical protein